MKIDYCIQRSPEWFALKVGKISGTRFGQIISNRQNGLLFELLNERLNGYIEQDEFMSEDMEYGIEHEDEARQSYINMTGIQFKEVGAILSETNDIHMASPDGLCGDKVLEIKCTMHGHKHIKRFFNGIDSEHLAQCINYFAVSPEVQEVHFVSFCPFRPERPLIANVLKRDTIIEYTKHKEPKPITVQDKVNEGLERIASIEKELAEMETAFTF